VFWWMSLSLLLLLLLLLLLMLIFDVVQDCLFGIVAVQAVVVLLLPLLVQWL
jgi:uncharacterized membrane protein